MKPLSHRSPLTLIGSFSIFLFFLTCQLPKQKSETLTTFSTLPGLDKTYLYSKRITETKTLLQRNIIYPKELNLPSAHLAAAIVATERLGNHILLPKSFYHKYNTAIKGKVIQDGEMADVIVIQNPDLENPNLKTDETILELEGEFTKLPFGQGQLEEVMEVLNKQIHKKYKQPDSKQEWEKIEIAALEGYVSKLFSTTIFEQVLWEDSFKPKSFITISIPIKESKTKRKFIDLLRKSHSIKKLGFQTEDEILSINGNSVRFLSISTINSMLKGKVGESIKIEIQRNTNQILFLNIPLMANWSDESVEDKIVEAKILTGKYNFIHMKVLKFLKGNDSDSIKLIKDNYQSLMEEAKTKNITIHGFILDLRDNSGGFLDMVIECMRLFVPKGLLLSIQNRNAPPNESFATNSTMTDLPLVVLINENTGSGSEQIAGVIQYQNRGRVLGTKSFGQGIIHNLRHVPGFETFLIKFPTSFLYLPDGKTFHGIGITPDIWIADGANENPKFSKPSSNLTENESVEMQPKDSKFLLDLPTISQWVEKNGSANERIQFELKAGQSPDYQLIHSLDVFSGILSTRN
ncbi:S41 family peptidase [Leptospira jelokensis]|uniref:Peptidase n=1 Tax=Leptospira jelokensis TaxID=2484931 RepID=A0A4Z1A3H6_9LEPT|nr:S41 family peptidase [Leptospira jelokensis]TGL62542.1 peptidase [Leptospira jelokensis]